MVGEGDSRDLKEYDVKRKQDGFFFHLYKSICGAMTAEEVNHVDTIYRDPEKVINFCYNLQARKDVMNITEKYPAKNLKAAKEMKEKATQFYSEGKDRQALTYYTQCVILTPGKSKDFAIALANRSAVLFSLKWYTEALSDIQLALESGYPEHLKFKLLHRRGKIELAFRDFTTAASSFEDALKSLEKADKLSAEKKKSLVAELNQGISFCRSPPPGLEKIQQTQVTLAETELKIARRSAVYPAMSDAVAVRFSKKKGRFAIAERDIAVGETILIEKAVVSALLPEFCGQNCSNCFQSMRAPLPCPDCTQVLFCSLACRDHAISSYHRYECKLADFFVEAGFSIICFLAYRALSQKSVTWFVENKEIFWTSRQSGLKDVNQSSNYQTLYDLVSHRDRMNSTEVFHRSMFTVFLLCCLESQDFFSDVPFLDAQGKELSQEALFIGVIINHFLEVLQFNCHEVALMEMMGTDFQCGSKSNPIGGGIYPNLALFNHSCEPALTRVYVKDTVYVQAVRYIRKGEEICENYGPIFFHSPKAERQDKMKKQYWFDCDCPPCVGNWPLMKDMGQSTTNQELLLLCNTCGDPVPCSISINATVLKCSNCGDNINLLSTLQAISNLGELVEEGVKHLKMQKIKEAQEVFSKYLMKADQLLGHPYQDYYKVQQNLWKCSWIRFGNKILIGKEASAATDENPHQLD